MSIVTPTTTIAVFVPDADADPREDRSITPGDSGIRAHFSAPSGAHSVSGGTREQTDMKLVCDPCTLPFNALVKDEDTGEFWNVVWVRARKGLGLDHMVAGVDRYQGNVPS